MATNTLFYSSYEDYNECRLYTATVGNPLVMTYIVRERRSNGYEASQNLMNPSIAVAGNNRWVTFFDNFANSLRCFYWNGSSWSEQYIDPSLGTGTFSDLTVSPSGNVYCSYCVDSSNSIRLGFQTEPSVWFSIPIEQEGTNLDVYSSIAVDQNEDVHIAYRDVNQGLKHATVTRAKLLAFAAKQQDDAAKSRQTSASQ